MERFTVAYTDEPTCVPDPSHIYLSDEFGAKCWEGPAVDKLAAYEDAEEQGLLVRLPCSIGSDVHVVAYCNETCSLYLTGVDGCCADCHRDGAHSYSVVRKDFLLNDIDRFGKTVFLTREEAESELVRRTP